MTPSGFYVYAHHRNDSGAPFYVGKGSGKRAWTIKSSGRNMHWKRIVAKHGRTVRVVAEGLDEELALLAEVELIDKLRRTGADLVNKTDGGEGARITDPAVKRLRAERIKAALSKPEVKQKLSDAHRAQWLDEDLNQRRIVALKLRWQTPESKAKKSAASKAAAARRRTAVLCVTTGASFESMAAAAAWLRSNGWPSASPSKICLSCKGQRKDAYGHQWRYATHD